MKGLSSSLECVELFHLLFLDQLGRKIAKTHYALKGGCNLRFFLKSIRYSQDMDLDIHTIRKETLSNSVNRILESVPFYLILRSKEMELINISESKQTLTTQRWKIQLKTSHTSVPINTKIEFSRPSSDEVTLFEPIDSLLIAAYQLTPIYASHYSMEAAFRQKVWALVLRTQTRAHDVFDLIHLLNLGVKIDQVPTDLYVRLTEAQENALSIQYEAFKSQVLSYLPFDYQQQYGDPVFWERMVLQICKYLSEIKCA